MSFTGKLGIQQSQPGNIELGIVGGGSDLGNQDASSTLSLTDVASCTTKDASATSTLSPSDSASTTTPWHAGATSTLAPTSTAVSSIKMLDASSSLSLVSTARGSSIEVSASSSLTLTSTGRCQIAFCDASSALSLTSTAIAGSIDTAASSSLSLTQSADLANAFYYVSASVTLALSDAASARGSIRQSLANTLVLTSTADTLGPHYAAASSALTITDTARSGVFYVSANSNAVFLDSTSSFGRPIAANASSSLSLSQNTSAAGSIRPEAASSLTLATTADTLRSYSVSAESEAQVVTPTFDLDTFTFIDVITGLDVSVSYSLNSTHAASNIISFSTEATAAHARVDGTDADAESILSLTDEARISLQADATSSLSLTQDATVQVGIGAASSLSTLAVTASVNIVHANLTASNSLEITQSVAFIFEQGDTLCTYSPFIGDSSDPNAPTPPPSSYTAAGATPGFRLQYPSTGPVTNELTLRNPNLGNIDRLAMVRINRETRGGTLVVFADPIWPKVETLLLTFSGLSFQQGQDLMEFMETHIGEEIRLIDHEDRVWKGVIVNPQDPIVQDGPGCRYTGSFEFEGELV